MPSFPSELFSLELDQPIWDRFFSVAPLVVIATRSADGSHDLFATHRGLCLGPANQFAFLASPAGTAVQNSIRERAFTVSFPRPTQVVEASLAAAEVQGNHPLLAEIPTFPAAQVDAVLLAGASVCLECQVDRIIEDLGGSSLVVGRIVAAYVDREVRRLSDRDDRDLLVKHPLLAFVAPGRFAEIDHTDAFPAVE